MWFNPYAIAAAVVSGIVWFIIFSYYTIHKLIKLTPEKPPVLDYNDNTMRTGARVDVSSSGTSGRSSICPTPGVSQNQYPVSPGNPSSQNTAMGRTVGSGSNQLDTGLPAGWGKSTSNVHSKNPNTISKTLSTILPKSDDDKPQFIETSHNSEIDERMSEEMKLFQEQRGIKLEQETKSLDYYKMNRPYNPLMEQNDGKQKLYVAPKGHYPATPSPATSAYPSTAASVGNNPNRSFTSQQLSGQPQQKLHVKARRNN